MVIDREVDIRRVQHRYVLDPKGNVGRSTETGGRVQRDVVALDRPGVAAWFARGVRAVLEPDDRVFCTFGVQRVAANVRLVDDVFGVVDLGFACVELQFGVIADEQGAVVAQTYVAVQLAAVFRLMQAGLVGLDLHAALTHDHVTSQGCDLRFLFVTRCLGTDEHGRVAHLGLVVHAGTNRLDVRARAVRTGFGQLCRREVLARNPVQVAVVGTARLQAFTLGFGHQFGGRDGLVTFGGATVRNHSAIRADLFVRVVHGARRQFDGAGFRRAVPGTRSRD